MHPPGRAIRLVCLPAGLLLVASCGGSDTPAGAAPQGATLDVGSDAPPVVLPATTGETVDLAAYRGEANVLLYFYEHAG